MRDWLFPVCIFCFVVITLSLLYFNPQIFGSPTLISPVVDIPITTPTSSPLSRLSTPMPVSITVTPAPTPLTLTITSPPEKVTSITLTAQKTSTDSAHLLWTIDGQAKEGFIVLYSPNKAPTFPTRDGDQARSSYDPAAREFTLTNLSGQIFLRVCEFTNNTCGVYSNQINLEF